MQKHVYTLLTAVFFLLGAAGLSQATGLLLTGIIDGPRLGGTPKAVELYALDDISDLSSYGLGFANNGGGSDGMEYMFPAVSVSAGDFLYVASEEAEFRNFFGFSPDAATAAATINGDDAVELFRHGVVIDVFGSIAVDGTGQPWEYLDGWAYRKDGGTTPGGTTFLASAWNFSGINVLDGEVANATAAHPFPAGSFSPGSQPQPVPTPEPGTLLLLGAGLAGLAGSRRKRQNTPPAE